MFANNIARLRVLRRRAHEEKRSALVDQAVDDPGLPDSTTIRMVEEDWATSVATDYPIGHGWIGETLERNTRKGVFNARPDGVTFTPLSGFPERSAHRLYFWQQFTEAEAVAATDVEGAAEAHAALIGPDPTAVLIVSHLNVPWGGNDVVVIVPLEPYTVADWLHGFRAAGVTVVTADGDDRPGWATAAGSDLPAPAHADLTGGPGSSSKARRTPSGWLPDPTKRHDYRYWNGVIWTKNVSDKGRQSTDPV
jgi:hypothetical protein